MQLNSYQEVVGTLAEVLQKSDHTELIFTIQKTVEIPRKAISEAELQANIGQRVGIFHSTDKNYTIRRVKVKTVIYNPVR